MTDEWIKLHNKELKNLILTPNIYQFKADNTRDRSGRRRRTEIVHTENSYSENVSGRYLGDSILHGIAPMGFNKGEECPDQLGDFNPLKTEFLVT
jgi:hypothetical protein